MKLLTCRSKIYDENSTKTTIPLLGSMWSGIISLGGRLIKMYTLNSEATTIHTKL